MEYILRVHDTVVEPHSVDITEYLDFGFYAHVLCKTNAETRQEVGEAD
jgi:hypothetical protein